MVCEPGSATSLALGGEGCGSDSCIQALAALDAETGGWDRSVQLRCHSYAVGYVGGEVFGAARNTGELVALIGELDTPTEVELLTTLLGFECVRIVPGPEGFSTTVDLMVSTCPVTMQQVMFNVGPDGALRELRRGLKSEQGVCIGRKPEGLLGTRLGRAGESEVGAYLARAAELEAASVVSFVALKAELEAHGAPKALVHRLVVAARDEVRHARVMSALAHRYGGRPVARRIRVPAVRSLEAIARENANEGCVTETWGALVGLHQARAARSPRLRSAFARVASDEVRHAALSWDLRAWLDTRLSARARKHVQSEAEAHAEKLEAGLGAQASRELEHELGLPSSDVERVLFGRLRERVLSAT